MEVALTRAKAALASRDPVELAERAGAVFDPEAGCIFLPYLTETYRIFHPAGAVAGPEQAVNLRLAILLLHYLTRASGIKPAEEMISFKEIPGGQIYIGPFTGRALVPIIRRFGKDAAGFTRAGLSLGGRKGEHGDSSLILPVLPRVTLEYILWEGDDEFPPSATILFPANVHHYLETEDCAQLAQLVSQRLAGSGS